MECKSRRNQVLHYKTGVGVPQKAQHLKADVFTRVYTEAAEGSLASVGHLL